MAPPQVVDPALQREVALAGAGAAEVERHRGVAEVVGDAVDELRERAGRPPGVERADREPVAQDDARTRLVAAARHGQVAGQREAVRRERAVHARPRHQDAGMRYRRCMPARRASVYPRLRASASVSGPKQIPVSAVSRLIDRRRVVPLVEVVDELRALVTDEPDVLELDRPLHRADGSGPPAWRRRRRTRNEGGAGAPPSFTDWVLIKSFTPGGLRPAARSAEVGGDSPGGPACWPSGQPPPGSRTNIHSSCWTTSFLWWHQSSTHELRRRVRRRFSASGSTTNAGIASTRRRARSG